ncbi:MAG: hypothetical protein UX28_C0001G0046 [Candidatus Pacebacteria bacterium GW2011_GWA1_46_10]|nr:MAG: hypothetical protein UX28_C0001G0046 [Candidatus Pacebacteria bacterium GW2011_GWA1_46_10]
MENTYQNPPAAPRKKEPTIVKTVKAQTPANNSISPWKLISGVLALAGFFFLGFIGVLISQKQFLTQGPVAPNVPESRPEAAIQQTSNCTLTFTVSEVTTQAACGYGPCDTDADCLDGLTCITADNGNTYCAQPEFEAACVANPSIASCCQEPTPTPTPTEEPTPTPTPEDNDVNVNVSANSTSTASVNVTINQQTGEETAATSGARPTLVQPTTQPEIPEELPVAGPADWLRYLQVGIATLGVGALLLLLL